MQTGVTKRRYRPGILETRVGDNFHYEATSVEAFQGGTLLSVSKWKEGIFRVVVVFDRPPGKELLIVFSKEEYFGNPV